MGLWQSWLSSDIGRYSKLIGDGMVNGVADAATSVRKNFWHTEEEKQHAKETVPILKEKTKIIAYTSDDWAIGTEFYKPIKVENDDKNSNWWDNFFNNDTPKNPPDNDNDISPVAIAAAVVGLILILKG